MEQTFLTDQEFNQVNSLKESENELIVNLGQIEYQLQFFTKQKSEVLTQLQALEVKSNELGQELQKKYGNGTINMENREFVRTE